MDDSNPIINTDYRFGGMLTIEYGLGGDRWLGGRVTGGHEHTHLGDECSAAGQREFPNTYERINVSWEFLDIGLLQATPHSLQPTWTADMFSLGFIWAVAFLPAHETA